MLESYNKSVINYGIDGQCTSLGKYIATCVLTNAFKMKLTYT